MKKVLVINRVHTDNFGDRLIAKSMDMIFAKEDIKVEHADYVFNPNHKTSIFRRFRKFCYQLSWEIRVSNYDAIIFGGGELISARAGFFNAFVKWLSYIKKRCKKTKLYLFSVGVTGDYTSEQIQILNRLLSGFEQIYVRDIQSKRLLCKITNLSEETVYVTPDSAFALPMRKTVVDDHKVLLGLTSLSRHNKHEKLKFESNEEMFEYYHKLLEGYSTEKDTVQLIYDDVQDRKTAELFLAYVQKKAPRYTIRLVQIEDEDDFWNEIGEARVVISPRMHACIFGLIQGKEVVPIVLSDKMESFQKAYFEPSTSVEQLTKRVLSSAEHIINSIRSEEA